MGSEGHGDCMELREFCSQAVSYLTGGIHGESAEKTHPGHSGPAPACSPAPHWTEASALTQGLAATCMGNWPTSGRQLGWKEMRLIVTENSTGHGPFCEGYPLDRQSGPTETKLLSEPMSQRVPSQL